MTITAINKSVILKLVEEERVVEEQKTSGGIFIPQTSEPDRSRTEHIKKAYIVSIDRENNPNSLKTGQLVYYIAASATCLPNSNYYVTKLEHLVAAADVFVSEGSL